MANRRPNERELRNAKDDLLERLSNVAKKHGQLPDVAKHEAFIAPALHKVAHEKMTFGEAPAVTNEVTETVEEGTRNGKHFDGYKVFRAPAPARTPRRKRRPKEQMAIILRVRMMLAIPEWRARLKKILERTPDRAHTCKGVKIDLLWCGGCQDTENAFRKLFEDWERLFGRDERTGPRITVSG